MKKLDVSQMELIEGGENGCLLAVTTAVVLTAAAGLSAGLTGPLAAAEWSLAALACLAE